MTDLIERLRKSHCDTCQYLLCELQPRFPCNCIHGEAADEIERISAKAQVAFSNEIDIAAERDFLSDRVTTLEPALQQMLHFFENPRRDEWLTDDAFAGAVAAVTSARAALHSGGYVSASSVAQAMRKDGRRWSAHGA